MMRFSIERWLLGLALLLTAACTVGPDYYPPAPTTDPAFDSVFSDAVTKPGTAEPTIYEAAEPEVAWWSQLDDPLLDALIERALRANHDLQVARANVRRARALLGEDRLRRYPIASTSAAAQERRSSAVELPVGADQDVTLYSVDLDATWELDLFGRVRRSIEARTADAEARVADQHAIALSLIAEVARTYLDLRGSQYRLEVAERNASNQQDTYELTQALLEGGRGTALDLARAEAQLQQTLASLAPLETSIAAGMHRLGVLVGEPPGALREALDAARDLPPLPTRLAIGDPASLLRRRPDVRAAERDLAAATARVGVQVGDLFPKITLDGGLGFLATDLGDLFDSAGRNHQIGPFLSWAAFDLGRVRQRIDAAEADAEASLARYEQTVLIVLEETENALVAFVQSRERQARLGIAADASARAAELARVRYRYGADSFLTVLDAERRLLEAQDLQAVAATETAVAFTRLYKALGGGWQVAEDPRPAVPDEAAGR